MARCLHVIVLEPIVDPRAHICQTLDDRSLVFDTWLLLLALFILTALFCRVSISDLDIDCCREFSTESDSFTKRRRRLGLCLNPLLPLL